MGDYKTIQITSNGLFKDKGSKFIGLAYPVKTDDEFRAIIKAVKKEYYNARHHPYAFILGKEKTVFRASDDGEPSNSAGAPILGQLRSSNLTNTLVVVVRYFGGTKLGISGLINAYKNAAYLAINNNTIVEEYEKLRFKVNFEYIKINDVMKIIKDHKIHVINQEFSLDCSILVEINKKTSVIPLKKLYDLAQVEKV